MHWNGRSLYVYLYQITIDVNDGVRLMECDWKTSKLYRSCSAYQYIQLFEMMTDDICCMFMNDELFILDLANNKIRLTRRHCLMESEWPGDYVWFVRVRNNFLFFDNRRSGSGLLCVQI